jgi:hypothetical protein
VTPGVSHDREDESLEAKALWFQGLTVEERLDLFDEVTELALELNPELANGTEVLLRLRPCSCTRASRSRIGA